MSKPTVLTVLGTRPEAIKMAPVIGALAADPDIRHCLVITAQHRELLDDVLELFDLRPDHDLDLMQARQSLVHGDTTTTFISALAAFYGRIPVGHVEAGLRTSSIAAPYPEEFNRRVADLVAEHCYCPTPGAARNITAAGQSSGQVFITGNTALDAVRLVYDPQYRFGDKALAAFAKHGGPKLLITAHRRESWGQPLISICNGLIAALGDNPQARACFCWHPNPEVRETAGPLLSGHPQVLLVEPPRYDVSVNLMAASDLILSDSGGIQEEVTLLKRFVLVLRAETERPEAVEAGFARVVGTEEAAIREAVAEVLPRCVAGELPTDAASPFGDGRAAERIHQAVRFALGLEGSPPDDYGPAG